MNRINWLFLLSWAEALAALLSGICWLVSASINIPVLGTLFGGLPPEVIASIQRQATWNAYAAGFAALTATIHVASIVAKRSSPAK